MMGLEYMLARRMEQGSGVERGVVMMRIAAVTVALAVTTMIITLAVFVGFREEITNDFRGFAADIAVIDIAGFGRSESQVMTSDKDFEERVNALAEVRSMGAYASVGCMAKSGDNVVGLQLKGIDKGYPLEWWQTKIVEGSVPDVKASTRSKQLLISLATARSLAVEVGDKMEILYITSDTKPRRDSFRVSGIFSTGLEEMDKSLALADVRDVRRLAGWDNSHISGYDIMLHDHRQAGDIATRIDNIIAEMPDHSGVAAALAATTQMRHPVVFDWLKAHTIIAQTIIIIMMVVLLFNMAAAMLIMVFERIGTIGVLKAQGMRNSAIRRVFLYRAALLFVKGAVWGNIIGLAVVAVQALWHPIRLDPNGYMLAFLPVKWELWWWVILNIGTLLATVLVMVLPSAMVARLRPEQSLKYKL